MLYTNQTSNGFLVDEKIYYLLKLDTLILFIKHLIKFFILQNII